MTRDEQEALSRLYSDDVIRLLPLKSGAIAVFNNARDLCAILPATRKVYDDGELLYEGTEKLTVEEVIEVFYPPKKSPAVDLKDLGLI